MVNNIHFTNIRVIMDKCMQNELLHDLTLEQTVGYVLAFNGILNIPELYTEKIVHLEIHNYRAILPCDVVSIIQVRDNYDNVCIPTIQGTFPMAKTPERGFKVQGSVIYTTFKEGSIEVAYNAIPTDEEGYPMILDDENYKAALEWFIKQERFTGYFETGKIALNVLQNTQREYNWAVARLSNYLKMPSISEWEAMSQTKTVHDAGQFKKGFSTMGVMDTFKKH